MSTLFDELRLGAVWDRALAVLQNPGSDVPATIMLFAAIAIVLLMLGTVAAIAISAFSRGKGPRRERARELEELQKLLAVLDADNPSIAQTQAAERRRATDQNLTGATVVVGLLLVMAVSLGATTGTREVCVACHLGTPHSEVARAGGEDPHAKVDCIGCHESGGAIASVSVKLPARFAHFARGAGSNPSPSGYGTVVSASCARCHESALTRTTHDEERGVKMSHREPLDAGAECRDCHTAESGVVSALTVGMAPCLRCHDSENESTECSYCHTKDVGAATVAHRGPAKLEGRDIIEAPDCNACHNMKKSCDPCHGGVRMPHSDLFKWWGHAREGAKDLWFNEGKACSKCHTAERRPCTACHTFMPGHPSPTFAESHQDATRGACDGCHNPKAFTPGRDLCQVCHGQPYVTR